MKGCTLSFEERASRCRVISGPQDKRLQEEKFQEAPVIVANNDAKYQINKDRARKYARATGATLRWSFAVDRASSAVLQNQALDKSTKLLFLVLSGLIVSFEFLLLLCATLAAFAR